MSKFLFASTKGGCGKTTLTLVVSLTLAKRGARTLVVDLDNQGNLSQSLIDFDRQYPDETGQSFSLLTTDGSIEPITTDYGVDLIAATPKLVDVEQMQPLKVYKTIRRNLAAIADQYHYILFDTPGAYSVLTSAALSVANYVAMPLFLDRYNIDALERTGELMSDVEAMINPELAFLGLVPCSVEGTTLGLPTRIAQRDIYRSLVESYGQDYLFPIVRERESFRRLQLDGTLGNDEVAIADIDAVCDHLIAHMENDHE